MKQNLKSRIENRKRQIKYSLGKKVGFIVLFFSVIYSVAVIIFGVLLDSQLSLLSTAKRDYNLARSLTVTLDRDYIVDLFNETDRIYTEMASKYGDDINSKEYLSEFDVLKTPRYENFYAQLNKVVEETDAAWINLHLEYPETGKICFVIDTDYLPNGRYQMGWQSSIRDFSKFASVPYEVTEDKDSGHIILTQAPFYVKGSKNSRISGFITVVEHRSNLNTYNIAFMLIFGFMLFYLTMIFVVVSVLGMRTLVVNPIDKLANAAESFRLKKDKKAKSHFFRNLNITSKDEIRVLADSMMDMEEEIYTYINDLEKITRKQEHLAVELDVTSRIQKKMLPTELKGYNGIRNFEISATMRPAREVGGDLYDYFTIDDNNIGITVADVSDKGIPAAFLMVMGRTLIRNTAMHGLSAFEVMTRVNHLLCDDDNESMFITVFFGIYTVSERKLSYVNAGHEDPVIFRKESGKYELIMEEHDLVIGIMDDIVFTERSITLNEGDRLFLYTDGVPDAADEDGSAFGIERMMECLNSHSDLSGHEFLKAVQSDVDSFAGKADQFDDMTMMCLSV